MPKGSAKQIRTTVRRPQRQSAPVQRIPQPTQSLQPGSLEALKANLKRASKTDLLGMLNEVRKVPETDWKNPNQIKTMAERFAEQFRLPVSEERLSAFLNAFNDAMRAERPLGFDEMVQRYGQDRVSEEALREMKKFIKPMKP